MLSVRSLGISFPGARERLRVVQNVSFELARGECLGLVGESGSGKTLTALALLGLVAPPGRVDQGKIELDGLALSALSADEWAGVRGRRLAMVFQEPTSALNPVFTIGFQLIETLRLHRGFDRSAARREALRLLDRVAIPAAAERLHQFPDQLSGGQCQRVMLAIALAGEPEILIADEPTTALDVTVQAQILALLEDLRRDLDLGILLITHDLAVVAETCSRMLVLHRGRVVEEGLTAAVFRCPCHAYTRSLFAAQLGAKEVTT